MDAESKEIHDDTTPNITVTSESITEEHVQFHQDNTYSTSYNPIESTINAIGTYCVAIRLNYNIVAQILCIPHSIWIRDIGMKKAILNTFMLIHKDHKDTKLVQAIIMGTIKESLNKGINIGYYWISDDSKESSIKSAAWYRPLLLKKARALDYELIKKANYKLIKNKPYFIEPSTDLDFKHIESNSVIRLCPNLEILGKVITFKTIRHKENKNNCECGFCIGCVGNIVGIVGYRPFNIVRTQISFEVSQLCYFDCLPGFAALVLTELFIHLKENNVIAIHGVFMSGIEKVEEEMCLSTTNNMYLDFYNLNHALSKSNQIATLYF